MYLIKKWIWCAIIGWYVTLFAMAQPQLQLASTYHYTEAFNISDYWVSEKLDGVRGYWDGDSLLTRQGHRINAPLWFTQNLGKEPIDGELWISRNTFEKISGIIRKKNAVDEEWLRVNYMIFDLPAHQGNFTERITAINELVQKINQPWIRAVEQVKIRDQQALLELLDQVINLEGEGLMLHKVDGYYTVGRTNNLLKLKPYEDMEGEVIGYTDGRGKYEGMMGALILRLDNGVIFKIGSGFSDKERRDPPTIGKKVTFQYNGINKSGVPRFAHFLRVREDIIQVDK